MRHIPFSGKNATFQQFREKSDGPRDRRIVDSPMKKYWGELPSRDLVFQILDQNPRLKVFADANLFQGRDVQFAKSICERYRPIIISNVHQELISYISQPPRSAEDLEMISFIKANLVSSPSLLVEDSFSAAPKVKWSLLHYSNLLWARKRLLGAVPKIKNNVARLSAATSKLSNKNKDNSSPTDEALVARAAFEAAMGRCVTCIVSHDDDVFSQAHKLWSLICEDYMSFLLVNDYLRYPRTYGERFSLKGRVSEHLADLESSYVVPAPPILNPHGLLPAPDIERAFVVIKPSEKPHLLMMTFPGGTFEFLKKKSVFRGRNTNKLSDLNCYVKLPGSPVRPPLPPRAFLFAMADKVVPGLEVGHGISTVDLMRAIVDEETVHMGNQFMTVADLAAR
jgi:hypothetical protein